MKTKHVDVLIAGAGLSGLSVARFLKNERPDISLMVLEKSERPGGAILSHRKRVTWQSGGHMGFWIIVRKVKPFLPWPVWMTKWKRLLLVSFPVLFV